MDENKVKEKLKEMKKQINRVEKTLEQPVKKEKETVNLVPPLPEPPEDPELIKDHKIPGFVTGGERIPKKWKEV